MLNPNQLKIFLTNIEDFILTRGIFYSQKTYEGLEEFASTIEETIIGKLLVPQEAFNKVKDKFSNFLTNAQKEFLWEWLERRDYQGPPIYKKILRLGYYSAYYSTYGHNIKTQLFQCETREDWNNYVKNIDRMFDRLHDEFEEYFRRRKERGKKFELLVWNTIECCLSDAQRAGNFDMEYQRTEPAIKAWEQRNGASFYGDWSWEDLLGKEVSLEEAYPSKSENNEENRQKTSPNSSPSHYYLPTNSQDRFFQTNTIPKTILPAKGAVDKPVKSNLKESNSNVHRNSLFPTEGVMLFLLISLVLIILKLNIKRKKSKLSLLKSLK